MSAFSKLKEKLFGISPSYGEYPEEDYVEIDTKRDTGKRSKIVVKPFVIEEFADIKETLDALREGYTIALINIKPLKDKDIIELKRAVNKINTRPD